MRRWRSAIVASSNSKVLADDAVGSEAATARPADSAGTIAAVPAPIAAVRNIALREILLAELVRFSSFFKLPSGHANVNRNYSVRLLTNL
jgi:hypothetical protein